MADGAFNAGSAQLTIRPRLATDFRQQLRTQLKSVNVEHKVSITPNIAGFQQKLNTAVKSATATVKVGLKPDLTGFQAKLNAAVQGVNAPKLKVQINPDITGFKSKLSAALSGVNTPTVRVKVAPNLAGFKTALNTQLATMGGTLKIKPDLDFTQANAQLATWRAAQGAVPLSLSVNLDTGAAMAQLAALRTMLRGIDLGSVGAGTLGGGSGSGRSGGGMIRRIRVQMEVDRASVARAEAELAQATSRMEQSRTRQADAADRVVLAERRLADATARHGASSTQALAASQGLARAQRTLADRSGDAARFLGAQADAHRRLRQAQNDQNSISRLVRAGLTGIAESAVNGATSLLSMVNPAGLVKTGLMALAGVSLIPLLGQLAQAAGVIALLPAMGAAATASIATIAVGSTGIMDAFKAAGDASEAATKDAAANAKKQADAARQVEDAERGVADARDNAAQTAKDGARQIAQAERQVQDAQERTKDAQEDLTRARKDAVEQIEDMNLALKGSAIDEEDALIALERARERLAELGKDGKPVTILDRREAENNVRQAQQRIDEVRERNNDLRLETEAANKAGVEGAAQVVAAKEGVADAIQAEKDAQENLGVTHENVARQNAQAQRQIEDALRRVADAQANQAEALAETSAAVDKYNQALANLSPNARDFVERTRELGDAWGALRMSVQDSLFDGMGAKMQELGGNYIPILTSGLTGLADVLNGKMRQAMDWLNGTEVQNDISAILDNTAEALGPLLNGLGNIGRALLDIATVGSELLPEVTGAFEDGTASFADTIRRMRDDGSLETFMRDAMDAFAQIWRIVKNIGGIASNLFTGSDDLGESWLDSIESATERWKEFLGTPEGQEEIKKFFADVKAIVDGIVAAIKFGAQILGTFRGARNADDPDGNGEPGQQGGLTPEQLKPGQAREAGLLRQGFDAADNSDSWIGKTARGFNSFFGFNNETDSYDGGMWNPNNNGTVAHWFGNIGNRTGNWWNNHVAEMGREWQVFTDKIGSTWDTITGWVGNVGTSISDLGSTIKKWIQDKASAAWDWLTTKVSDARTKISKKFKEFKTGLADLRQNIQDKITDAIGWFTSLPTKIGEGFRTIIDKHFPWLGGALDGLQSKFQTIVDGIGSVWDGLKSKLATPINWVIDTVFNNGIVKFWNAIASKIGMSPIDPIGLIGDGGGKGSGGLNKIQGLARGGTVDGVMSGYSPGRDDRIIAVGGGEAVMRPEWTRAVGKDFVENANAAARSGGVQGARKFMGYFANGGIVESMEAVVRKHFPMLLTNDRAFSGLRFTDDGYHSKGMAGDFSNGGDAGTPEMKAFASYVADEYQNRTLELIHSPFNRNINNYKDVGDGFGFYGAGTMNQHRNHVHWAVDGPVGEGGAPDPSLWDKIKSGVGGAIGRVSTFFRNLVADQFEKPINALGSTIPNPFPGIGDFGYVPKKMYDTLTGKALDWVRGKAEAKDNAAGSTGSSGAPLGAFGGNSMDYAREIVEAAKERGLPSKAAKIALMTAMAESSLKMWANNSVPESLNYPHDAIGSDHDSVGLFQQRDNGAWGTVEQRMNPRASAGMFYDALMGVDWQSMSPAQAAQAVQRSAFADGSNYAAHEGRADELVAQLYDAGGVIEPNKLAVNLSGKPEAVFTNEEWMLIHELVRLLGMTDFIDKLAATDGPKELSGEDITGLKSPYGTGAGTVAEGGYTLPTGELSSDLRAFDKLHGNQSSGAGGTGGSKFPAFGSPEHVQQAGAIFQNATSTFAGKAKSAGMQFLSGWIPDEILNPQGLVGGLISAGQELSSWFHQNHGTPDILNDPIGSIGQIAGGFIGGGTPPPMPTVDPGQVQQQVDSLRNNAPAQASGTGSAGDTYNFYANNAEELWRRFQTMQAQKAAGFMGR